MALRSISPAILYRWSKGAYRKWGIWLSGLNCYSLLFQFVSLQTNLIIIFFWDPICFFFTICIYCYVINCICVWGWVGDHKILFFSCAGAMLHVWTSLTLITCSSVKVLHSGLLSLCQLRAGNSLCCLLACIFCSIWGGGNAHLFVLFVCFFSFVYFPQHWVICNNISQTVQGQQ